MDDIADLAIQKFVDEEEIEEAKAAPKAKAPDSARLKANFHDIFVEITDEAIRRVVAVDPEAIYEEEQRRLEAEKARVAAE